MHDPTAQRGDIGSHRKVTSVYTSIFEGGRETPTILLGHRQRKPRLLAPFHSEYEITDSHLMNSRDFIETSVSTDSMGVQEKGVERSRSA